MVGVLRDPHSRPGAPLAPIAGVPDLPALVEQFTAAGGTVARLHLDGDAHGLPVEVSTSAYRVVMEALTNVRRHAPGASAVDVRLRRTPKVLLLRVANDGPSRRQLRAEAEQRAAAELAAQTRAAAAVQATTPHPKPLSNGALPARPYSAGAASRLIRSHHRRLRPLPDPLRAKVSAAVATL
jgi:hypothetical protein